MAQIQEERIVIKLSKLIKNPKDVPSDSMINVDLVKSLEEVAQELVSPGVIVEVEAIE